MALRGKLGFIGGGRMGEALIQGLLKSGLITAEDILATDPVADRRVYLADTYGVILYQEQVLRIAHQLAGLSLADADLLLLSVTVSTAL